MIRLTTPKPRTHRRAKKLMPRAGAFVQDSAATAKEAIARQIEREMKAQRISKTVMALKMNTSRAALNRLLDSRDTGLTLTTLAYAAAVLGAQLDVRLVRR
jgi:hypothetical protein